MGGMRRIGAAAMALALVGGLGACGDDGGGNEDAADETTTTEGSDEETTTTEDSGDGSDTGSDTGSNAVFGNLEECSAFAGAYASLGLIFLGGAFGGDDTSDFDAEQVLSDMEGLAEDAPGEVQDAIDTVVSAYQEVFDNLQDSGFELDDAFDFANPEFASAIEPLNDEDFNDANTVVSDYLTELCTQG